MKKLSSEISDFNKHDLGFTALTISSLRNATSGITDYDKLYRCDGKADIFISLYTRTYNFFGEGFLYFSACLKGMASPRGEISAEGIFLV
jgi:hypothetical protein